MGIERIHVGAHYPSDVAAGAIIDLASAQVHAAPRLLLRGYVGTWAGQALSPGGQGCAWALVPLRPSPQLARACVLLSRLAPCPCHT
ncbi:hypothetical protein ACFXD5_07830 [Streptomyces sp. NPDC059385]|uniref:hypothetical protein n=1 Tax=Streptomyces sp. NPDC059385 TaxID=3346817 RepID=UPI0036C5BEA2